MVSDTPASHAVVGGSEGGALQGNKKVQVLPRYQRLEMKLVLNHEQSWDHDLDHGLLALGILSLRSFDSSSQRQPFPEPLAPPHPPTPQLHLASLSGRKRGIRETDATSWPPVLCTVAGARQSQT